MKNLIYLLLGILLFLVGACEKEDTVTPDSPGSETEIPLPDHLRDGITQIGDDSLAFVLFAPKKETVHLIGDFNDWKVTETYQMHKSGDRFWIKIGGLQKNREYICQYLIDRTIRIADPYADKISDPDNDKYISRSVYPDLPTYPTGKTTEIAMVVSTNRNTYPWQITNFKVLHPENMVIYEILIRDFTNERTIKAAKEKIAYLKDLGINAVELMPFNEFEGNNSWGYNPSFYFAPDKAYGTAEDYKNFIDECHANGIAVIMDIVFNHSYGQSPLVRMYQNPDGTPSADNPWYNQKSNFSNPDAQWGYDFNHESIYTKQLIDSICSHWMTHYQIDGFRFDFTKGFSNTPYVGNDNWGSTYDAARIKNLKRIYDAIKKRKPEALMICEHLADNSEEKELADYGLMLWGNMNYNFNEATMGYIQNSDISWTSYKQRKWSKPRLVAYMESHDEERLMFKNKSYGKTEGSYDVKDLNTGLARTEAAAVMLLSFPGPKMIWQFGELGYDYELNNDRMAPKPVRWDYFNVPARKNLYSVFAAMNTLRNNHPAFSSNDYTIDVTGAFKQIGLKSAEGDACIIANFDVRPLTQNVTFSKTGNWTEYFSNNSFSFTEKIQSIELQPGEYRVYLNN